MFNMNIIRSPYLINSIHHVHHSQCGLYGEREDPARRISLISGKEFRVKGEQAVPRWDRLRLELPGGRLWDPLNHEPESVSEDAKEGLGSPTLALTKYGAFFLRRWN